MIITIRKSDNKLITWNGGNITNDPDYEELDIVQDYLPEGKFEQYYYNSDTQEVYIKKVK